jgi:hypothetical protein
LDVTCPLCPWGIEFYELFSFAAFVVLKCHPFQKYFQLKVKLCASFTFSWDIIHSEDYFSSLMVLDLWVKLG